MRWLVGMIAVAITYDIASEQMPNFADSARPTLVIFLIAMTAMMIRSNRERV